MTDQSLGFEEPLAELSELYGHHRLKRAYEAAQLLVRDFPNRAQAYFQFNLVVCLTNRPPGVLYANTIIRGAQVSCPDFTPRIHGDMRRDRLIGFARYRRHFTISDISNTLVVEVPIIRELHDGDANRIACLTGVMGRLHAAIGQYDEAVKCHALADNAWYEMGDDADPLWIVLNLTEWLRAEVLRGNKNSVEARKIYNRIVAEGSRSRRAKLIFDLPAFGPQLDSWAMTLR